MLTVSKNSKYLCELSDGNMQSFFWLGDTAWLLLQKLNLNEIEAYFQNRAERHFNVVQAVLIHNMNLENSSILVDTDNPSGAEGWWDKAAAAAGLAQKYGIYMAFLPVWGSILKKKYLTKDNAEKYAEFLAKRFKDYENVIWVLGGDIRGSNGFDVWNIMGEALKKYTPRNLITFHPFGRTSSAMWFNDKDWLDFNMFQSGHRRYDQSSLGEWDDNKESEDFFAEDNWRYVRRELSRDIIKPVLDGEPSYEHIPQGLHDFSQPFWKARDVRRYAYWSAFEGACGHTYGCNSVMQFYMPEDKECAYNASEYWTEGIKLPGSLHMKYFYELMTSVDFSSGCHNDETVSNDGFDKYNRITVFSGKNYIFIYNYSGREFSVNIDRKPYSIQWFDPTSGKYQESKIDLNTMIKPPKNADGETDMVLVIKFGI